MQLGLIGLGRMGFNMRERLRAAGHEVIGFDHHPDVTDVASLNELVEKLAAPRVVWIMVPVQFTVFDAAQHYHIPMLCSPWFFSTYRGS